VPTEPFNAAAWLVDRHADGGRADETAYISAGRSITYGQLQAGTWRAAHELAHLGLHDGDRVVTLLCDEPAFPAVFLGAVRAGIIPIPVSTMLTPGEVAAIVKDSGAAAIVVSERFASRVEQIAPAGTTSVVIGQTPGWFDLFEPGASPVPTAPTGATDPAFWLYTSGTTGLPKGAIHRHRDIRVVAETYARSVLGIGPDDLCYSVSKLFFAFGLGNALIFPLSVGAAALIDPEPPTPTRAAELARTYRPTLFFATPGFCAAMVDGGLPDDTLASVRFTVTAGEALPAEVMRRFTHRFGTEMLDGIGSTEALHIFCSNHPGDVRPGSSGRPVEGYDLRLLDDHGVEITEPDTPGYLWVRGDSVAAGYWQRPDVSAANFVDGWLRTGDVYLRSADDYYTFFGRNSDMIKAGGIWVSPAEVESVLIEHDDISEAAVVAGHDADGLEMVVAFVVPRAGRVVDERSLERHCRDRMASFKRPRRLITLAELPKTATGKVRRYALRDQLAAEA
jgi:benzoate-CoA ligase family protein